MLALAESTGGRGSKDPFTHSETAWNAASDSQTSSCQLLERKIHLRKSPRLLRYGLQLQRNHQNKSNLGCQLNQPQILMQHPNFYFFETTVLNGMDYHFTTELTENE
jgi:hypothetical protein